MLRAHVLTSIAVLLALPSGSCASSTERREALPPIVVGSDLDNAPFAWIEDDGRPAGRDVEMMERIAVLIGREFAWRRLPFGELLDACAAGEVDVVCATLGVTPERARSVRFTRGYFETQLAVVVRADGPLETLDDLVGRRVGAGPGTTSEKALFERLRFSHPVLAAGAASLFETGAVDAVVLDAPAAQALVAASGGRLRRLPESLAPETYALAVAPDEPLLRADLDRALAVLKSSGTLAHLDAKYLGAPQRTAPSDPKR